MHAFSLPDDAIKCSCAQRGADHVFAHIAPRHAALIVIDMQNYLVAPGYMGEVPMARWIVPAINQLAAAVRRSGACVFWVLTSSKGAAEVWPALHSFLLTPERSKRRLAELAEGSTGFALWPGLDCSIRGPPNRGDTVQRLSGGSSTLWNELQRSSIDTVLIAGTATNVCCESSARDAMMLNFKVTMVSDACAARSDEVHRAALLNFYGYFGDVMTSGEIIAALVR
ncbi:MAG: cysteine hydrolase family protein [Stellaceae bacterium]